jgi:hypothetical protein
VAAFVRLRFPSPFKFFASFARIRISRSLYAFGVNPRYVSESDEEQNRTPFNEGCKLGCNKTSQQFLSAPKLAIDAVDFHTVTSEL